MLFIFFCVFSVTKAKELGPFLKMKLEDKYEHNQIWHKIIFFLLVSTLKKRTDFFKAKNFILFKVEQTSLEMKQGVQCPQREW